MININTGVLDGISGKAVKVEVEITNGIPSFVVIGQGDMVIKEAGERIKAAIKSSGFEYPKGKIIVNLSPANLKKKGSQMELAVAIGILAASGQISRDGLEEYGFFGELSLSGRLLPVKGILPMTIGLEYSHVNKVVLPLGNSREYDLISQEKLVAESLMEVVELLTNKDKQGKGIDSIVEEHIGEPPAPNLDFAQVKGQAEAKRAITIASAGCHGILMVGSPGSSKTMMARRIPTILPPMTREEMIETWTIYSTMGKQLTYFAERPFRSPYYKISMAGLLGGGNEPRAGEITLAHNGVLFLDELGEYSPRVLDGLRTPLDEKKITLNRKGKNTTFPADFMLACASNPCKCGNLGSDTKPCICSSQQIDIYKRKLMGPLADRIHLHIYVPNIDYETYCNHSGLDTATMRQMVFRSREMQRKRFENYNIKFNSSLEGEMLKQMCPMTDEAKEILKMAYANLDLNPRTCENTIKIARTIADIEGEETINSDAITEALSYRGLEKIYGREL